MTESSAEQTSDRYDIKAVKERIYKMRAEILKAQQTATSNNGNHGSNPTAHIEADFPEYLKGSPVAAGFNFVPSHCEALLNGAIDLLQRCVIERSTFDALRDSWQHRWLQLEELRRATEIARIELDGGILERDRLESQAISIMQNVQREVADSRSAHINRMVDGYFKDPTTYKERDILNTGKIESEIYAKYDRAKTNKEDLGEIYNWMLRYAEGTGRKIHKQRLADLFEMFRYRMDAFEDNNGPHNTIKSLDAIRNRFMRDLAEARARLQVGAEGLKEIFSYNARLPTVDECIANGTSILDSYLAFTRNGIRVVNNVTSLELQCTHTVYVDLTSPKKEVSRLGQKFYEFEFVLPSELRARISFARVNKVCAYMVGKAQSLGVWQIGVAPPPIGIYEHRSSGSKLPWVPQSFRGAGRVFSDDARPWLDIVDPDSTTEGRLDQRRLGAAWAGQVMSRISDKLPEPMSVNIVFNLSPFGLDDAPWSLFVGRENSIGEGTLDVTRGVEIDLLISFLETL